MKPIPQVPVQTEYLNFKGGVDIETPALRVGAGFLLGCLNYEPDSLGGYRRPAGYERYSGRARPSDATYFLVAGTLTSTPAAGTLLTMGASTGLFVQTVPGGFAITGMTGTVPANTSIIGPGPVNYGTTSAVPALVLATSNEQDAGYLVAAANVYRALITAVPGSGPVRGVHVYRGGIYAFRNNAGGTACLMYQATSTGWTQVAFGEVVPFTNANTSVNDGDVLTQGAVTSTVQRVVVETGSLLSGTNTGRLFITGRAGGSYSAAAATTTGGGTLTLGGVQTAVSLPPGGRYEFDNAAFTGSATAFRMYGANGVGPAFEFDGTVLVTLDTKGALNTPKFIKAHKNYLFLAQNSSAINSSVGNPYRFVAAEGAVENAAGEEITGFAVLPGESLGIFSRNKSQALTGAGPTTWGMQTISPDVGAIPYTVQSMSDVFYLDDRGIISVKSSQNYGNFQDATLSRRIQRLIDSLRSKVIASHVNRERSHYKLLMSDGSTLTMGYSNNTLLGFCPGQLGFSPTCASSGEDDTGKERVFYGADNGFVYELNRGSTFDGDDIESFLQVYYVSNRSPEVRKRYRRMTMEMSTELFTNLRFQADFSYGDPDTSPHFSQSVDGIKVAGVYGGGLWGVGNWDQLTWDGQDVLRPSVPISGTGINIALNFYSKTTLDFGHILSGAIIHFTPRRLQRT